jgi:importin subunit alpha-1
MSRRGDDRRSDFKNLGLTNEELRRRREEATIELRRNKREDSLRKRRNVASLTDSPVFVEERSDGRPKSGIIGQEYVRPLLSNDFNAIYEACHALRKIVSKELNPPVQDIIELDIVGRLVELLSSSAIPPGCPPELADKIVFESAWVLTNIASGASPHTMAVVQAGAVPIFIQLLSSPNRDIKEQSVWALGNIAGDCSQLRDFVIRSDAIVNLLQIVYEEASKPSPYLPLLRNTVWTVSNMCRGKPAPTWSQIVIALNVLTEMLSSNDDEILIDSCWAFSYITDGADQNLLEVIKCGAVSKLANLLRYDFIF